MDQFFFYPYIKLVIVMTDLSTLFFLFSTPVLIQFFFFIGKFDGIIKQQREEYSKEQYERTNEDEDANKIVAWLKI